MRVLFWGTPTFALPSFRALTGEGYDVVGVVTQPDRPAGRGRSVTISPVKESALAEGIAVLQPERARGEEFLSEVKALEPDVSVVVAFGQILEPRVLDLPPLGSINVHASLLPELRGAAPVQWSIIRGHGTTGVTMMRMEAGLDSGPILYQVPSAIAPDATTRELSIRLSELGAEALVETLTLMDANAVEPMPQDHRLATYAPKLGRELAHLDWTLPAVEVARWIRGLDDVPGAWSQVDGANPVKLFAPAVEDREGRAGQVLEVGSEAGFLVGAGEMSVRIGEVQPAGKRRMSAAEWVRGRGLRVGSLLA